MLRLGLPATTPDWGINYMLISPQSNSLCPDGGRRNLVQGNKMSGTLAVIKNAWVRD